MTTWPPPDATPHIRRGQPLQLDDGGPIAHPVNVLRDPAFFPMMLLKHTALQHNLATMAWSRPTAIFLAVAGTVPRIR